MTGLFDLIQQDKAARDFGMTAVANHADENSPRWTDRAFDWICKYAESHSTFISEECTAAAHAAGLPEAHDARAWGHPFRKAAKKLVIKRIGFGISNRRHQSSTPLWNSLHPNFWRKS
ncbi:hypothetical protein [Bradyrhizobium prioriisuperbiae]|uniref:hypothetical protein n=1 Tax=Bradyrhizobium prioriisuperbiae TaxID=2854389 RepID=UPI0028E63411|nr:hypothetical protein [Bradyrhizobium prioritasuperba]